MSEIKPKLHRFLNGYKGSLTKQGKVFKQWSTRYFILEKKRFKYYENDSLNNLLGEMIIDQSVHLYDVNEEVDGYRNLFYIVGKSPHGGGEENLFLSAANEKEKHEWIEALTDSVHDGFKQIFQPDLWSSDFYPFIDVQIFYKKSGVAAENGNIIRPSITDSAPDVTFKGIHAEDKFSFIMLDIDPISSIENPLNKFYLHWGVINISGLDIRTGEQLAPYVPPAPVYNSGLHRFFFLVFKQRAFISPIVLNEITELFHKRDGFPFMKWVRLMDFGDPAGINGFYAGWESFCDELHNRLNYVPPETFRSPHQESALKKEQSRKRVEVSMMDLYRDLSIKDVFPGAEDQEIPSPTQVPISLQISFTLPGVSLNSSSLISTEYVKDGSIIPISYTGNAPNISYEDYSYSEDHYYTLILTDPDFPSRVNSSLREFVHWVVVNIPSNRISEGKELLSYVPPAAPYNSGLHRYIFVLFKQHRQLTAEEIHSGEAFYKKRMGIRSFEWIKTLSACYSMSPIGLEAFISEYDDPVDKIHESLDWVPPAVYQSSRQIVKLAQKTGKYGQPDLEDIETEREARVAELEYELKTSVLQTIAQLHSDTHESISPNPEPVGLTNRPQSFYHYQQQQQAPVTAKAPVPPPGATRASITTQSPQQQQQQQQNQQQEVFVTTTTTTTTTRTQTHHNGHHKDSHKLSVITEPVGISPPNLPMSDLALSGSAESNQSGFGIKPEEWKDQSHLEKAPLNRQNAVHLHSPKPKSDGKLETINEETSAPNSGLPPIPGRTPVKVFSPGKPFASLTNNDLDSLFAPSPVKGGAGQTEIENYDDDEEEREPFDNISKISSSNTSGQPPKHPPTSPPDGSDHRGGPQNLFNKLGLFKAQSQYISSEENSLTNKNKESPTKPKSMAKAASMYFSRPPAAATPPPEGEKGGMKRLSSSGSFYKAFDRQNLQEIRTPEDISNAFKNCSTYDISTTSVFEGG
jgi:phosphatidylethanolamine-binding protein (PEBP) family uncharacterized protein